MAPQAALLIGKITHVKHDWEALSDRLTLKEYGSGSREDFLKKCSNGEYDDVVVIYRSNASTSITGPFNEELVSKLPRSLKYIVHNGAGYDNIDVDACTRAGIAISNTPIAVNNATADIAAWLMIGALRRITIPVQAIRAGKWQGNTGLGHDPQKKVLGILGMGGIGQELATRARAFGMTIHYHNRRPLPKEKAGDAKYVSFSELLSTSDVLSLNLALNASTRHIIGAKEFAQMKDGITIVNTARGALIDEAALVDALKSGKVYSAGLDVYEEEPKVHPGLLENENVVLLPHIGTATYETQADMERLVLENLRKGVFEGKLVTPIAEQEGKTLGEGTKI